MTAAYKEVRALARGLDVLAAVNRGIGSPPELAAALGLDRATVHRLLETMVKRGYLVRSDSEGTYRTTSTVFDLSDGFREESWITEHAVPALRDLLEQVRWPSDVATFDGSGMVSRESTHRFSPLAVYRPVVQRRIRMLSALGFAHLAFSADRERRRILAMLRRSTSPDDRFWQQRADANNALEKVRASGHALVAGEVYGGIMALAVPVIVSRKPVCCVNIVVSRTAMTIDEMPRRFLGPLKKAAARIQLGMGNSEGG